MYARTHARCTQERVIRFIERALPRPQPPRTAGVRLPRRSGEELVGDGAHDVDLLCLRADDVALLRVLGKTLERHRVPGCARARVRAITQRARACMRTSRCQSSIQRAGLMGRDGAFLGGQMCAYTRGNLLPVAWASAFVFSLKATRFLNSSLQRDGFTCSMRT